MSGFQLITLSCYACGLGMLHSPCVQYRICTHFHGVKFHDIRSNTLRLNVRVTFISWFRRVSIFQLVHMPLVLNFTDLDSITNIPVAKISLVKSFYVYGIVWCDIPWWLCYIHSCTHTCTGENFNLLTHITHEYSMYTTETEINY